MKRRVGIIGTGWVGASVAISTLHSGVADELLVAIPGDEGLRRLRDEAADRLAGSLSGAAAKNLPPAVADPGRDRRLAKIHLLNQWLDAVSEKSRE